MIKQAVNARFVKDGVRNTRADVPMYTPEGQKVWSENDAGEEERREGGEKKRGGGEGLTIYVESQREQCEYHDRLEVEDSVYWVGESCKCGTQVGGYMCV